MTKSEAEVLSKVPAVTLGFWIVKILATTLGETGGEPCGATDVAGLGADGVEAAVDDVLHGRRVDARALDQRLQRVGPEVGGVHVGETAATPPNGRADGVDDVGLRHVVSLLTRRQATTFPARPEEGNCA